MSLADIRTNEDEERLFELSAPVLLPMIQRRLDRARAELTNAFKANAPDLRHAVGLCVMYEDLLRDLENRLNRNT